MTSPGVALLLQAPLEFKYLVRVTLPLWLPTQDDSSYGGSDEQNTMPGPLPPALARLGATMRAVEALSRAGAPLAVWGLDSTTVQAACTKKAVLPVFKQLWAQQQQLGVTVTSIQANVQAMPAAELLQACKAVLQASLLARGWWKLAEGRLLSTDLLAAADGQLHTAGSIDLDVDVQAPCTLTLLLRPGGCWGAGMNQALNYASWSSVVL